MPAPFESQPDELSSLMLFVDSQRADLLAKLDGLTEEQATAKPTASELSLFGIVKHCAFVERRWVLAGIGDREIPGVFSAGDRDQEFRADDGETVAWLRDFYAKIVADNRALIDTITEPGKALSHGLDTRWILLHLVEELARHAGHADIIRDCIDGTTGV